MAPAARTGTSLKGPACAGPSATLEGCPLSLDGLFGYSKLQELLTWIIARLGEHDGSFELMNSSCKAAALLGEKAHGELQELRSELRDLNAQQRGLASEATLQDLRSEILDAKNRMGDFASKSMVQEILGEVDNLQGSQSKFALEANVGDLRNLLDSVRGTVETFPTRWSANIVEGVAPMGAACTELDQRVAAVERSHAEFERRIASQGISGPADKAANAVRNAQSDDSAYSARADRNANIIQGVTPMEVACTELDQRVAAVERSFAEFERRIASQGISGPADKAANARRTAQSDDSVYSACADRNADMQALLEPLYKALDDLRSRIQQNVAVNVKSECRFNALESSLEKLAGDVNNRGQHGARERAGATDGKSASPCLAAFEHHNGLAAVQNSSLNAPGFALSDVDRQSVANAETSGASAAVLLDQIAQNKQLEHRLAVLEASLRNLASQGGLCGEDGVKGGGARRGGAEDGSVSTAVRDGSGSGASQPEASHQHVDVETALRSLRQEIQDELRRQHSKLQGLDGAVQNEMHPRLDEMCSEINKNATDVTNLNVQLTLLMHQLSQHTAATAKCLSCSNERAQRGNQVVLGSDGRPYKRTSVDGSLRLPQLNKKIPNFGAAGAPLRPRDAAVNNGLEKGAFGAMSTGALDVAM
eukprot:TRINITY_DN7126_c0_g1_i1.p1 TRINITY_DN7126_c0_g1~~TRINITY_DN7126_c0_g1_i1.p1  ORF type:complete len:653 (-),score=110.16 TRINITY_DN7126_c0_g1_i1:493-2451(-)